jgi:Flp pilus assembly protein TadG
MGERDDRGAVTAEAALVLPLIAVFAMAMAWLVALGISAVRVQDAAREAARVVARGESAPTGRSYARRVAPSGSTVSIRSEGGDVVVVVTAHVHAPGGLLAFIPGVAVHGRSVAVSEDATP